MKRKILVVFLVFAFLGLGSAKAKIRKPDFYAALGISSFEAKLCGTKAEYFNPLIAIETLYSYKNIDYGMGLKSCFVDELTLGFMPVVKYNFSKELYLKAAAGKEFSFLSESGRAVYKRIYKAGGDKVQLWVRPEKTGWTGFFVAGIQGKKVGVEAGIEYRELKAEFSINDIVKDANKANLGILVRLTFKLF